MLVPSMIHQLVHSGLLEKADLSSLMIVNSGAAYLPPKVADAMQKLLRTGRLQEGMNFYRYRSATSNIDVPPFEQGTVSRNVYVHHLVIHRLDP